MYLRKLWTEYRHIRNERHNNDYGLGAMGVFFAPRLYETYGENFRVIANGERKERLENKGVTVNGINYKFPIITPDVMGDEADLIIIG